MATQPEPLETNRRVLIVDDNPAIHDDFKKILAPGAAPSDDLDGMLGDVFGTVAEATGTRFELDSAFQGEAALEAVRAAVACGRPYALAFMDVRMPPGWDGVKTTSEILQADQEIGVVICSAYSDHSFEDLAKAFGETDRVLILRKPFDMIEVRQLAHALHRRWGLARQAALKLDDIQRLVVQRTRDLADSNAQLREEAKTRERLNAELRLAQKLEAVGRLAAGVAHEINTPIQFVSDSIHFVQEGVTEIFDVLGRYEALGISVRSGLPSLEAAIAVEQYVADTDLPYLVENIPQAIVRSIGGLERVATIVRSMKAFAHPDQTQMALADANESVRSSVTLVAGEYKYVADVELDLADLPPVMCHVGDLNQVIVNLLVNASHAISDRVGDSGLRGHIGIRTWVDGGDIVIAISDTGGGISDAVAERIFEPFFTTKAVGRGTGQGLAIARIVIQKHHGSLTFETKQGEGTTFFIRMPIEADACIAA
jgi:signal transduction histidine kinase